MKLRFKKLNNKSRKGLYVYVKEDGYPARYYKYDENALGDSYKEYYMDCVVHKSKKGTIKDYTKAYTSRAMNIDIAKTPITKQADKYIKKVRKRGSLKSHIRKGISTILIRNVVGITSAKIMQRKRQLMANLVLDKELLDIIVKEENMKKLKHRFEYRLSFHDREKELANCNRTNESMDRVISDIKKMFKYGEDVNKDETDRFKKNLEKNGFQNIDKIASGHVYRVDMRIIFRRG